MQSFRDTLSQFTANPGQIRRWLLLFALAVLIVIGLAQVRVAGLGDDWQSFSAAVYRMLGLLPGPMYGPEVTGAYYVYNPPWVFIVGLPVFILPSPWSWAVGCVLTMIVSLLVLHRWKPAMGYIKPLLVLLSPPMMYIFLHGQMDALMLGGLLFPVEWWWVVALSKPQVTLGLAFGVPISKWVKAGLILAAAVAVTLLLLGNWPMAIARQGSDIVKLDRNYWGGLWPFQVPVGVGLLVLGISRKDERYLVSASPFLAPYAPTSTLIGPWLAAVSALEDWQAALVFLTWWGAIVYRLSTFTSLT